MHLVRIRPFLLQGVTLLILATIVWFLWNDRSGLERISLTSPLAVAAITSGITLSIIASGMVNLIMLRNLGVGLTCGESIALAVLTTAGNLLGPMRSGAIFRAFYLKKVHSFALTAFASSLIGFYLLSTLFNSFMASGALAWMVVIRGEPSLVYIGVLSSSLFAVCCLATWIPPLEKRRGWLSRPLTKISKGWATLKGSKRSFATLLALIGLHWSCSLLTLWGCYALMRIELGLLEITIIGTLGAISSLISITPGGLGIYESAIAAVGYSFGVELINGVTAAVISRAVMLVLLMFSVPVASFYLMGVVRKNGSSNRLKLFSHQ